MHELILFYKKVLKDPFENLPSLFFMGVAIFGLLTLLSLIITELLVVPFIILGTVASLIALWYIKLLGTLSENLEKMEQHLNELKRSNDQLHEEIEAMGHLRERLEQYAETNNSTLSKVIEEINRTVYRLEQITRENEKVLLYKIAQDLEFMDHQAGMTENEYQRFIERVPRYLQIEFESFDRLTKDKKLLEYSTLATVIHKIMEGSNKEKEGR